MRAAELLALGYFLYLPAAGRLAGSRPTLGWPDLASAGLASVAVALHLLGETLLGGTPAARTVRDWAPGVFLILAYWMSAPYIGAPAPGLQRWLLAMDRDLLGRSLRALVERAPRLVLEVLELAYLLCYPFVPAGLLVLVLSDRAVDPDRFWTAVLAASFPCYALLPWMHTRPPRVLDGDLVLQRPELTFRRVNMLVLHHGSVPANTFPSAHVSSTLAVALMVTATLPFAGAAFLALAALIAISTVVGRYHYGVDAVLGAALGVLGFTVALYWFA